MQASQTIESWHFAVTQGFLFTAIGIACLIFVGLSAFYIIEWHRFGVKEREVFIAESVYLVVSVILLSVAILAATFY